MHSLPAGEPKLKIRIDSRNVLPKSAFCPCPFIRFSVGPCLASTYQTRSPMKTRNKVSFAAVCGFLIGLAQAQGELTFTVTDLGTLGGNTTTANNVSGHGQNAAGMIVGSSTTADNSEHAFLYVRDKMYDLNTLCALGQSDYKVITLSGTISES